MAEAQRSKGAGRSRYADAVPGATLDRFKRWFWRPPRPHGEAIVDRTVSFLELFYDLVYVAVIGQAAHHLAEHVSGRGLAEFAVVFAMIWIAWINGSLYLELHGREDGRTRSIVFVQMGVLVLLAVFTADAAGAGGRAFALVYATFLALQTWLWSSVRREDRRDHPEFLGVTGRFVTGVGLSAVVLFASAFLPAGPRLLVWAAFVGASIGGWLLLGRWRVGLTQGLPPTHSLVERFGLFTIVVLGEVIFGIVDGLSGAEPDGLTIATGMLALVVGFGLWWLYFDLVGRRLPRGDGRALVGWVMSHLPLSLAIAAAGAAMVSLLAHAHDPRTPAGTAWLLAGAVAAQPARADPDRTGARRRRAPRLRLPAAAPGAGRGRGRGPRRRRGTTGAVAPRAAARRDPLRALGLRRQPLPARGRLGRGGARCRLRSTPALIDGDVYAVASAPAPESFARCGRRSTASAGGTAPRWSPFLCGCQFLV